MSTNVPTLDEMLAALSQDPRFAEPAAVYQVQGLIALLPQVIGEERLGHRVNLREFLTIEVEYLKAVLGTDFDKDFGDMGLTRDLYGQLIAQLEDMNSSLDAVLAQMGTTVEAAEANLPDQSGFIPPVAERFRAGNLTFADLLRMQPSVFLPQAS